MQPAPTLPAAGVDIAALKDRLRQSWMAGDYDRFSRYMENSAVDFLDRIGLPASGSLLDVACGSGQLALIAARRGLNVTGIDLAPNWIEAARDRAQADGLDVRFETADAEALPFADASFDVVATIYGAMFAPRPDLVAAEMARVARPGGLIAMANWTAEGFIGRMFSVIAKFITPPGMPSPLLWGNPDVVRKRFDGTVRGLIATRVSYTFHYPFPPSAVVEFFRKYYGPANRAFAAIEGVPQREMRRELEMLWESHNRATDGSTIVDSEYLEVVARRA